MILLDGGLATIKGRRENDPAVRAGHTVAGEEEELTFGSKGNYPNYLGYQK